MGLRYRRNLTCVFALFLTSLLAGLQTGCDLSFPNDREGCDGYPYVANDVLPDTVTLHLDGPVFRFDLSEAPVFKHTAGKTLSYSVSGGANVVWPSIGFVTGELELFPRGLGTTRVKIWAEDDCEKFDTLGVFVQVTDASLELREVVVSRALLSRVPPPLPRATTHDIKHINTPKSRQ